MEYNNKNDVYEFLTDLRACIPFYGFSSSVIELLFMKYMADFEYVNSPEEFKILMDYKNMLAKGYDYEV